MSKVIKPHQQHMPCTFGHLGGYTFGRANSYFAPKGRNSGLRFEPPPPDILGAPGGATPYPWFDTSGRQWGRVRVMPVWNSKVSFRVKCHRGTGVSVIAHTFPPQVPPQARARLQVCLAHPFIPRAAFSPSFVFALMASSTTRFRLLTQGC